MAARKRKRAKSAKRSTSPARRSKAKTAKPAKRPARKTKKAARKSVKRAVAKKAPARKTTKAKGEGDYAASRAFLKDQAGFVEKNKSDIPAMGKAAEKALDGPEGAGLRDAEATAAARSRDVF